MQANWSIERETRNSNIMQKGHVYLFKSFDVLIGITILHEYKIYSWALEKCLKMVQNCKSTQANQ